MHEIKPTGIYSADEIAEILTYIRQSFGNNASTVTPREVAEVRSANSAMVE